ncbi:uncharacterized protein LOC143031063 [Oratosquilla oratoria]|uniref:uncharacterized protein LOC143031063 n=1 Tax=Oratosquilla oratoria TaxID=337810 RepID=UPI003F75F1DF
MCTIVLVASAHRPLPLIRPKESSTTTGPIQVKPGFCPPKQLFCRPIRIFRLPAICSHDGNCGRAKKCCFDRCLKQHVCKHPQHLLPHPVPQR